jgi:hypothetical protein
MAWSHRIGEIQGKPAQFLMDDRFRAAAPVRELPRLALFKVYCQQDPGSSFWHPDETASLDSVEDSLRQLWQELGHGWAVYVMRIATRGLREYYVYLGGTADFSPVLARLRTVHPGYRVEHEEIADADWEKYVSCLPPA